MVIMQKLQRVIISLCILLLGSSCKEQYEMTTHSMLPVIKKGNLLTAEKYNSIKDVKRWDIVVFNASIENGNKNPWIKRIIGMPNEKIRFSRDKIFVDNSEIIIPEELASLKACLQESYSKDISYSIPEGAFFVIGDNLQHSTDSRLLGHIPFESILGKAIPVKGSGAVPQK